MFGLRTRKRQAYVSRVGADGRALCDKQGWNLGKALGVKEKTLPFTLREFSKKALKTYFSVSVGIWSC